MSQTIKIDVEGVESPVEEEVQPVAEKPEEVVEEQHEAVEEASEEKHTDEEAPKARGDVEEQAKELGWKPGGKNKFGETIGPDEFVRNQRFLDKIDELNNVVKGLSKKMVTAESAGYKKAIAELKNQQRSAIEEADVDAFERLEREISAIQRDLDASEAENVDEAPAVDDEQQKIQAFVQRQGDWWNANTPENLEMVTEADRYYSNAKTLSPNKSVDELLDITEQAMHDKYPHRFGKSNPRRAKAVQAVASSSTERSSQKSKYRYDDLTDIQKQTFNLIKKDHKEFSVDEYMAMRGQERIQIGD